MGRNLVFKSSKKVWGLEMSEEAKRRKDTEASHLLSNRAMGLGKDFGFYFKYNGLYQKV